MSLFAVRAPLQILYVDDNPLDQQLVRHALEREHGGFRLTEATSREDFEQRLNDGPFDLILSDFNILGYQGLQLLDAVNALYPGVPVIIVTGTGSEETGVEALKRGAADYVIKTTTHIQRLPQTIHSVIERRSLLAERDHAEEKFRQLAENIDEVFWLTECATRRLLYISPAYERVWHRSVESLLGHSPTWMETVHPDDAERVGSPATWELRIAGEYDAEYRIIRPDGEIRWIRDRAFPVRDESGRVYRIAGIAQDITERRDLEQQFLRAQRLESLGTLAGGIAHDLNNVLAPIILSLDLLRPHIQDDEGEELLQTIASSARRGANMVQQVLSFAKGLGGMRALVDVHEQFDDIARIVRDTFPKGIVLRRELDAAERFVLGDPTQLHQVLINLCLNARDAMPAGGQLTIRTSNVLLDGRVSAENMDGNAGQHLVVEIADTGSGIAPDVIDRVFDPFFTTKAPGHGTGLGLSTSLTIVKSHGGFIRVLSGTPDGTRFLVYLPTHLDTTSDRVSVAASDAPRGNGQTILVVDDERAILRVTQRVLESHGYRVLVAENGAEAAALYAQRHADIAMVLTDLMMPVMSGAALVKELRGMNPAVRVVAMSGMTSDAEVEQLSRQGVKRLLQKPYRTSDLLNALREQLEGSTPT